MSQCVGECWEIDPPPDSILWLPPPPIPHLFVKELIEDKVGDAGGSSAFPCDSELCNYLSDFGQSFVDPKNFAVNSGNEFLDNTEGTNWELSQSSSNGSSSVWFLVLVLAVIFSVIIASLLAMFLLKFKDFMSKLNNCQLQQNSRNNGKQQVTKTWSSSNNTDDRYLWTTLTPKGTTEHYITGPVQDSFYENTYEQIVDRNYPVQCSKSKKSFVDYSFYEDPTPLMESYQLSNMENRDVTPPQSGYYGTYRRADYFSRPRVSTPTRIENPNMPPLNLYPTSRLASLRRQF